jgi:hypothetical protein
VLLKQSIHQGDAAQATFPFYSTEENPMPKCEQRERLLGEWQESVAKFSDAVKRLRQCNGDGSKFAEQHEATEQARRHAEEARKLVEHHRSEHGC